MEQKRLGLTTNEWGAVACLVGFGILAARIWHHGDPTVAKTLAWCVFSGAFWLCWIMSSETKWILVANSIACVGAFMNKAVLLANGGFMPVIGETDPYDGGPWIAAIEGHRLLLFADRTDFGGCSPGDFLIFSGVLMLLVGWIASRAHQTLATPEEPQP